MIVLDAKTDYSFMRGFGTPKQWLARCKEADITALGIADYCSTWGHAFFHKAFKGSGVKLIYGAQVPVVVALDKDPRHNLVTLLATDDVGEVYRAMTTAEAQMYYRPRLTWKQVREFKGIVILNYVMPGNIRSAELTPAYLGMSPEMPEHMLKLSHPRVPAYGPRFPSAAERQGYELLQAISEGQRLGEVGTDGLHALRKGELARVLGELFPSDMENLEKIAAACNADIPKGTLIVAEDHADKIAVLKARAMIGAMQLGLAGLDQGMSSPYWFDDLQAGGSVYEKRLDRELMVIHEKKFEDYFFFVADVVKWAKKRMFVGPGRGSSGGSLLCYLLGITTVDPIKFGTLFERFIDITRPDLPDIDTDFPDNRREEVFTYLKEKYGAHRVARLGTISEFGGKSAINDTGKALGIPFDVTRAFGKYTEGVGQGMVISPSRIFGKPDDPNSGLLSTEDAKLLEKYPDIRLAEAIDGHARHHGVHAAGVVVTNDSVTSHGTVTREGVLELDMRAAEDLGLVKMDALGLRTLSVIQDACDLAGIDPKRLYELTWDDPKVYDLFNKDRVTGIFQFEGTAVRGLMRGITVEKFDDICALTSLARPGPLIGGAAGNWVKVRRGDEKPRELHRSLQSTFGVICYQEQAMAIVRDLAGFTEPEVNGFRRAVGKKDPEKLKAYRETFVTGFVKIALGARLNEIDALLIQDTANEKANDLWEELCEFGSYAFNLAHAVEYAMISYMTAWLKVYHPLPFACAALRHAVDDEQGKNLLRELVDEGYEFVPFDPDKSMASWAVLDGKLYGGFDSIRGVGEKTAATLLGKRENYLAKHQTIRDGDKSWLDTLTDAQAAKILKEDATPWHELNHFGKTYALIYAKPDDYKSANIKAGIKGPVLRIKDIPEQKGEVCFLGKITKRQKRDLNEETRVQKRDGKRYDANNWFINLTIEDDTGSIGATINRFKAPDFEWILEGEKGDLLFRGNIIEDGKRWVFIDKVRAL